VKGRKKSYKVKNVRLSNHLSGNKLIIYSMVFCTIILINLKNEGMNEVECYLAKKKMKVRELNHRN